VRAQGRRTLLARGWAELAAIDDQDDCFVIDEVNQQVLFPGSLPSCIMAARARPRRLPRWARLSWSCRKWRTSPIGPAVSPTLASARRMTAACRRSSRCRPGSGRPSPLRPAHGRPASPARSAPTGRQSPRKRSSPRSVGRGKRAQAAGLLPILDCVRIHSETLPTTANKSSLLSLRTLLSSASCTSERLRRAAKAAEEGPAHAAGIAETSVFGDPFEG
jgi:hypothetical protein